MSTEGPDGVETFEFILIVLACIIVSSVLGRFMQHVALPLVQIAVGLVTALVAPGVVDVQIGGELFLVMFIAPLLFDEARRSNRRQLWESKWTILSLAVGLVLATVLAVGFALNFLVPSIPLAAAFACAAALGPTDAAAVGAMGSNVGLCKRQRVLLSGESLINDASGVVSFHFAIAAAVTGAFSVAEAAGEFAVLFFGGIALGAAVGGVAFASMKLLQHFGYEDTVIHVIYEVFTPFFVFLLAEWAGVSGILAVVAAGLVMAKGAPKFISIDAAKRQMVSDNFWKVIVFLINGIVFVMLGMQLPLAIEPAVAESYSVWMLLLIVCAITLVMTLCRFAWLAVMELFHRGSSDGVRGFRKPGFALRDALVMTLAGPKGAVTLSIVFTIPLVMPDGSMFPQRQLILFLTAAVILLTLLLSNFVLPLLAPQDDATNEEALHRATVQVLEDTISELQRRIDEGHYPEYVPALRLVEARYRTRLAREHEKAATGVISLPDEDGEGAEGAGEHEKTGVAGRLRAAKARLRRLRRQARPLTATEEQTAYVNDVEATALTIELDSIRHLRERDEVTEDVARELRRHVYALQNAVEGV